MRNVSTVKNCLALIYKPASNSISSASIKSCLVLVIFVEGLMNLTITPWLFFSCILDFSELELKRYVAKSALPWIYSDHMYAGMHAMAKLSFIVLYIFLADR